jgi:hypothetical protein
MAYPNIITDTLQFIVEQVKTIETEKCEKTALIAPGFLSVSYMVELCNFIYLPSQFLVGFNKMEDIIAILNNLSENGIKAYAVAGYDDCIPHCLVAWIKFIEIPFFYKDLITNYLKSTKVVMGGVYANDNITFGENYIYQYNRRTETITEGDIYLLHINACYGQDIQIDWSIFKNLVSDFININVIQRSINYITDWESGFDLLSPSWFGDFDGVIHLLSARDTKLLYAISYELSKKFININNISISGLVLNPYIINNPFYEANYGYIGYTYWQGNSSYQRDINTIFQDIPKNGLIWFNDQFNNIEPFYNIIIKKKLRINNTSTECKELASWIKNYKPLQYPLRNFVSISQLKDVLEKVRVNLQ